MINLEQLRTEYKPQILALAAKHGVENVRVFGSVARGEQRENSDIDFLVTRLPKTDLLDIGSFYAGLEDLLLSKIDVVTEGALSQRIRDNVIKEAVPL